MTDTARRFHIGTVEITLVVEACGPLLRPAELYPEATPECIAAQRGWLEPSLYDAASDRLVLAMQGFVLRSGATAQGDAHVLEYSLKLGSNPAFTASVLVAYTRACIRMAQKGQTGAATAFDVPPALLSPKSGEELRRTLL